VAQRQTANIKDADVGEDGEEEEDEELSHRNDSKRELYISLRAIGRLILFRWAFVSPSPLTPTLL
jgi:hypothetical protein